MSVRYVPAGAEGWLLLAAGSFAMLCKPDDAQTGIALWEALPSPDPIGACLTVLTRNGLTAVPPFAMVSWSGEVGSDAVVLARGEASVTVTSGTGTSRLDGSSVTTWLENRLSDVSAIDLGEAAGADSLPLSAGVVFASSARLGLADSGAPAFPIVVPAAAPAPAEKVTAEKVTAEKVTAEKAVAEKAVAEQARPAAEIPPMKPPTGEPVAVPPPPAVVTSAPDPNTITALPESTISEPPELSAQAEGYAHLFEETVVRKIEDAAVRPPEESDTEESDTQESDADEAGAADGGNEPDGDHDGLTIMSSDIAALRKGRRGGAAPAAPAPPAPKFFLELSTGGREPLVRSALVGRSPSVSKVSSGQVPRLITIPGDQDISRNHAQFALEGGTVVVTDLHSRNGTSIILPGKAPQVLRQGEPTPVIPGTVVDLGGGVRLTVIEEAS